LTFLLAFFLGVQALGTLVRSGANMEARANAARALGILRAKAAVPDLVAALRSKDKDTDVIFESLIALQKIRDESAAPGVAFLLRDLNQSASPPRNRGLLQNHPRCRSFSTSSNTRATPK
jgi:hypothetical protein